MHTLAGQPSIGQALGQLGSSAVPPALQLLDGDRSTAIKGGLIEALLAVDRLIEPLDSGRGHLQDPADVLSRHEVPGRSQNVGSEEVATVERDLHVRCPETRASHPK